MNVNVFVTRVDGTMHNELLVLQADAARVGLNRSIHLHSDRVEHASCLALHTELVAGLIKEDAAISLPSGAVATLRRGYSNLLPCWLSPWTPLAASCLMRAP